MHYFKHHNTAHEGQSIRCLLDDQEYEAYALFWTLLELCSKWSKRDDSGRQTGEFEVSIQTINRIMGWKSQRSLRNLQVIFDRSLIDAHQVIERSSADLYQLRVPKWLKFQETRGLKTSKKHVKTAGDIELDIEREEKAEPTARKARLTPVGSNRKTPEREALFVEIREQVRQHWRGDKGNHAEGCRLLAKLLKPEELPLLVDAFKNFMAYKARSGEYIPHLKTWAKNWRDWVNDGEATKGVGIAPLKEITLQPGESAIDLIRGFNEQA